MSDFGTTLKKLRKENHLTLVELADRADTSNSYLSLLERNQRNTPKVNMIKNIANGLSNEPKQQHNYYDQLMTAAGYTTGNSNGIKFIARSSSGFGRKQGNVVLDFDEFKNEVARSQKALDLLYDTLKDLKQSDLDKFNERELDVFFKTSISSLDAAYEAFKYFSRKKDDK